MRIKKDFNLREVCGEYIIVAEGKENIDFCNIISMNESSAYLWKEIQKSVVFLRGLIYNRNYSSVGKYNTVLDKFCPMIWLTCLGLGILGVCYKKSKKKEVY